MATSDQLLHWMRGAPLHHQEEALRIDFGEVYRSLAHAQLYFNCTEQEILQLGQQLVALDFIQTLAKDVTLTICHPVRITPTGFLHLASIDAPRVAAITRAADGQFYFGNNLIRLTPTPFEFFERAFNANGAYVYLDDIALDSDRAVFCEIRNALTVAGAPESLWETRRRQGTTPTGYRLKIRPPVS